ncbi:hypothetical protein [Paenibacillus sabinae]|uniref:Pectate lyase superfamily protein domain-containing protein n=1 Tax=Paenibacillus sabinae T27 TaxID=1268072 RepID=X4ZFC6_9BACL|nr:hypothetical protein [Paenibacillus sabinae]AHV96157.1 hypothetical protein PSAB_06105 [Paenibacillus sabinae T27]
MAAGNVPTGNVSAFYGNTTAGLTASPTAIDAAIQDIIQTINDNWSWLQSLVAQPELGFPDGSVTTNKIRDLAVSTQKLADAGVTTIKIADGTITTAKLADMLITAAKIADGTITEPKYGTGSVSSRAIATGAVGATKLDPALYQQYGDIALNARFGQIDAQLAEKVQKGTIEINVKDYGLDVGGGINDDTVAITNAISAISTLGGGRLFFPRGRYKVTPSANGALAFSNMSNFEITGDKGAEIFCDPVLVNSSNLGNNRLLRFTGCKHFSIHGLKFKMQLDFASTIPSGSTREDQTIFIYSYADSINEDFNIYDNEFEYYGPQLHDPLDGETSRLSTIAIGSDTNIGPTSRLTNNFSVFSNKFNSCLGRTVYLLLSENGSVYGNQFKDLGALIYPDGSMKTWAVALAIRILGCKNITATGNTINGYKGELVNPDNNLGAVVGFVCGGGVTGGISEDVTITGNVINFNNTGGYGLGLDSCRNVIFADNTIEGTESFTDGQTYGVRSEEISDTSHNVKVHDNIFRNLNISFDLKSTADKYDNIQVYNNDFIVGTNNTSIFNTTGTKANIGDNYYSDKASICAGPGRQRKIYATSPPTTGTYTRGDICYNTDWDIGGSGGKSPIRSWVYQYNNGTINVWRPLDFSILKGTTPPAIPSWSGSAESHTGLLFIDSATVSNGVHCHYNGSIWVKYDGTAR